jgi:hypothetical protein
VTFLVGFRPFSDQHDADACTNHDQRSGGHAFGPHPGEGDGSGGKTCGQWGLRRDPRA